MKIRKKEFLSRKEDILQDYRGRFSTVLKENPHYSVELNYMTNSEGWIYNARIEVINELLRNLPRRYLHYVVQTEEIVSSDGSMEKWMESKKEKEEIAQQKLRWEQKNRKEVEK